MKFFKIRLTYYRSLCEIYINNTCLNRMRLLTPAISLIFLVHMNNLIKCSILALSFTFREGNLTANLYACIYLKNNIFL